MTWTATREEPEKSDPRYPSSKDIPARIHVRAIIDIDNEQAELKDLIASLQKHVKEG